MDPSGGGCFLPETPFYPVTEILRQVLFASGKGSPDAIEQLGGVLTHVGLEPTEAIPLIAPLLNLSLPPEYPPPTLTPGQQRRRLLAILVECVLGSARAQPLIIATEDLHWVDPSTLELIQLLVEQGATARLLLLYTARPEFHAPWSTRAHHTQINLNRLTSDNVRTMVAHVAAKIALSDNTVATVVERTSGVPLFVEELTRAMLESGDAKLTGREIPVTLHDSLMSRLDRLGPAKEIVQIGAVIGSDFSYELLHAVHPIAEENLQDSLRKLAEVELINARGIAPDATYRFKHALIRDAAYDALLKSRRKDLHLVVARTIDEKFSALKEAHPEVLARHWTEAGEIELAIAAWKKAGDQSIRRSANSEAIHYFANAIRVLEDLADGPQRSKEELTLQVTMAVPLMASKGYGAPEVEQTFARAAELCRRLNESAQVFSVLRGLHRFNLVRARHHTARELAEQCITVAQKVSDPNLLLEGHLALGESSFYMGNLASAEKHLSRVAQFYNSDKHRPDATRNVQDPAVASRCHLAIATELLGYSDQAAKLIKEAVSLAEEISHPFSRAYALNGAAMLHQIRREMDLARKYAEATLVVSSEGGFSLFTAEARFLLGCALARQGQPEEGIFQMHQGLSAWRATGAQLLCPFYLGSLAEGCCNAGSIGDAANLISEGKAVADKSDEQMFGPELLRLEGELELLAGTSGNRRPEKCFLNSIDLARRQGAKSWELRATTSLARLLRDTDRHDEARTMLAEIYNWFTEGFDTADLIDAKALLDELRGVGK
jgi:predicted ATPase